MNLATKIVTATAALVLVVQGLAVYRVDSLERKAGQLEQRVGQLERQLQRRFEPIDKG